MMTRGPKYCLYVYAEVSFDIKFMVVVKPKSQGNHVHQVMLHVYLCFNFFVCKCMEFKGFILHLITP